MGDYLDALMKEMNKEEITVLKYFIKNRSVGELVAFRELRGLYRIDDPAKVLRRLVELGILERGPGCYNLSKRIIEELKKEK